MLNNWFSGCRYIGNITIFERDYVVQVNEKEKFPEIAGVSRR
jgi:hypothetical protein